MTTTAKIVLNTKIPGADGQVLLGFNADYNDDRNKEWAKYTPSLSVSMTVVVEVAARFSIGQRITLSFDDETELLPGVHVPACDPACVGEVHHVDATDEPRTCLNCSKSWTGSSEVCPDCGLLAR